MGTHKSFLMFLEIRKQTLTFPEVIPAETRSECQHWRFVNAVLFSEGCPYIILIVSTRTAFHK